MALIAFAANSVLCRLALGNDAIDAASFTVIRLLSGVVVLFLIINFTQINFATSGISKKSIISEASGKGSWSASFILFLYAITFSYAYISLDTGTGALILFGSVQLTMILVSLASGARLHFTEWSGISIAFAGFVYLVLPELTTPSVTGFALMAVAGISWGLYTLKGKDSKKPLMDTAYNFFRTIPFILLLALITLPYSSYSAEGIALSMLSGGITSGIGYAIWYIALAGLGATQAAVLQLLVPVIAALGGIVFVSETITLHLIISAALVLGGVLMVILGKYFYTRQKEQTD